MGLGNVTENVRDVNDNAKKYIDSSIEFYKLSFFKKFMKATVILSMSLLLGAIAFMAILIFSIAISVSYLQLHHLFLPLIGRFL